MISDQKISSMVSIGLMVATIALGFFSYGDKPFLTSSLGGKHQLVDASEEIVARLWEDPLEAVESQKTTPQTPNRESIRVVNQLTESIIRRKRDEKKITILAIPIPETSFANDIELRVRMRYALQIAMSESGYRPDKRNYLSYFSWKPEETISNTSGIIEERKIAYEWFVSTDGISNTDHIVLWIPESLLSVDPLYNLGCLYDHVCNGVNDCESLFIDFAVMGPNSSNALVHLAKSVGKVDHVEKMNKLITIACKTNLSNAGSANYYAGSVYFSRGIAFYNAYMNKRPKVIGLLRNKLIFYSSFSTISDNFLHDGLSRRKLNFSISSIVNNNSSDNDQRHWYFNNMICTDDQLTDKLVDEFKLRGIKSLGNNSKILLLSEFDTSYGRFLPTTLEQSVIKLMPIQSGNKISDCVIQRKYLQGLDQVKGDSQQNNKEDSLTTVKSAEEALIKLSKSEEPYSMGSTQLDYVNRLVKNLLKENDPKSIKAVGILGSDLNDKILLLMALKKSMPNILFFTTDLDTRLWHPSSLSYTKNMIVASTSFTSNNKFQYTETLRDVYQTAFYCACRRAISSSSVGSPYSKNQPEIYEIGLQGPINLTSPRRYDEENLNFADYRSFFGLTLGLYIMYILGVKFSANETLIRFHKSYFIKFIAILLFTAFTTYLLYQASMVYNGEEWYWWKGVSIWPTEFLRSIIIIASAFIVYFSYRSQKITKDRLIVDYLLKSSDYRLHNNHNSLRIILKHAFVKYDSRDAEVLYYFYQKQSRFKASMLRALLLSIAYIFFSISLVFLLDKQFPTTFHIRGDLARLIDTAILSGAVFSFIFLVFYILDSVLTTTQLLDKISSEQTTNWPNQLIANYRNKLALTNVTTDDEIAGYIDVKFAAEKSEAVGKFVCFPFILLIMFIISRISYFDNWSWPVSLILIFLFNLLLASISWIVLRHTVSTIKKEALKKLVDWKSDVSGNDELLRLKEINRLREQINQEHRGAYANFFQDPLTIAMLLPSGFFGVVIISFQLLFKH